MQSIVVIILSLKLYPLVLNKHTPKKLFIQLLFNNYLQNIYQSNTVRYKSTLKNTINKKKLYVLLI